MADVKIMSASSNFFGIILGNSATLDTAKSFIVNSHQPTFGLEWLGVVQASRDAPPIGEVVWIFWTGSIVNF
jgi:hypothetical protein